jgi:hypothetical protein
VVLTESAYGTHRVYVFAHQSNHSFKEVTATSGLDNVGTAEKQPHNVVPLDDDLDGDEDLLIGFNSVHPVELWQNTIGSRSGRWLGVKVAGIGVPAGSNRSGFGAKVTVYAGSKKRTREVGATHGNCSPQRPTELLIGTGGSRATKVRVEWRNPSRSKDEYTVGSNGYVTLKERPRKCSGARDGWKACRGSGCAVYKEKLSSSYPLYYLKHPGCTPNPSCGGRHYSCNANCPAPTSADK